jgi:hypothetical protein
LTPLPSDSVPADTDVERPDTITEVFAALSGSPIAIAAAPSPPNASGSYFISRTSGVLP